jgi:hypothetical protein
MAPKQTAFKKDSPEEAELMTMFVNGTLSWSAKPNDVKNVFPQLWDSCNSTQLKSGFNRVRKGAEDFVEKLQSCKVDCCLPCFVVVVVVDVAFFPIFVDLLVLTFYVHTCVFSLIVYYGFVVAPNDGTTTGTRLGVAQGTANSVPCKLSTAQFIKKVHGSTAGNDEDEFLKTLNPLL